MPEFVSVCQSVLCATVHKYRTPTTLLCKVYLSRHPQPVSVVILMCSWSEFFSEGLRFAEKLIAHLT